MAKKNVFVIKEDKEIVEGVFLCKGDMLIESGKGRWTIIEADGDEEDKEKKDEAEGDEEDKKEESDEDDEDKKEESEADKKKMAALRAKKESRK